MTASPRLLGPGPETDRNLSLDTPSVQRELDRLIDVRVYEVTVTNAVGGTVVRHDLRATIIPLCHALGQTARVAVLSVAEGCAVLRNVGSAAPCLTQVRFERVTR